MTLSSAAPSTYSRFCRSDSTLSTRSAFESPFGSAVAGDSGASPMENHLWSAIIVSAHCSADGAAAGCSQLPAARGARVIAPLLRFVPEISMMCAAPRCRNDSAAFRSSNYETTLLAGHGRRLGAEKRLHSPPRSTTVVGAPPKQTSSPDFVTFTMCYTENKFDLMPSGNLERINSLNACRIVDEHLFAMFTSARSLFPTTESTDHRNAAECYSHARLIVAILRMGAQNWSK